MKSDLTERQLKSHRALYHSGAGGEIRTSDLVATSPLRFFRGHLLFFCFLVGVRVIARVLGCKEAVS
jgi:hypothetical protein